ncbi:hypothetical protein CYLTODRAFT_421612 [Cylindrobasidium torrendii FP15055 ss-10]|uniref:Amidohydrolase-related domain-containing protein n=1 Tax=Cylindrobasidium torrendii FP15055 ss-10 TaxID=1314674 RepID=A0A0D7BD23_9AGAR|nr:hypothetical protein CYLTODRAFT_421612 [Cylindrobasidium torrendii FP15055 ss-10]
MNGAAHFSLLILYGCLSLTTLLYYCASNHWPVPLPLHSEKILAKCRSLHDIPSPPKDFADRQTSDRFVPATRPTILRNATVWTGRSSGLEVLDGVDILLDGGIIRTVGHGIKSSQDVEVKNLQGAWVTPGIIDMHSHMGMESSPDLAGANDVNSLKGSTQPWLRSLDGLNTHDESHRLAIAGGTTTALILPGSSGAIGGQAFTIKTRPTGEKTPSSMLVEAPFNLNGTKEQPLRWQQMKHACGENPAGVYEGTRMDTVWDLRQAYATARRIKDEQDSFCAAALSGTFLRDFPEDPKWDALVDVLRGRVKVHNHCYEAVDIDGMVRLSQEFKFPIAAFHHAHESYLVTELIKQAFGKTPASAMFAELSRYKREAYRHSEYAPRILHEAGIQVIMKTDHPHISDRYLLHEAQQAHYYGLPWNVALSSVISTPATVMGLDHRIGFIDQGHDADIVVWDSHPLSLGAAPTQVYIDGIPQLEAPVIRSARPASSQVAPKTPVFDDEARAALGHDGLPPLDPVISTSETVIFENVNSVFLEENGKVVEVFRAGNGGVLGQVVVKTGSVLCHGFCANEELWSDVKRVDLEGGSLAPGLLTIGSPLGMGEIEFEASTNDGEALARNPALLGDEAVLRAVDGLQFQTRSALIAYRAGVTNAVATARRNSAPAGMGAAISTGAKHKLEKGALIAEDASFHISMSMNFDESVSTMIGSLRYLLSGSAGGEIGAIFERIVNGELPLVVTVNNADIMASLVSLKREAETRHGASIRMVFHGATEAHLIAKEIADANVGVFIWRPRSFPAQWEQHRILPGPPLSRETLLSSLLLNNVSVALGAEALISGPSQSVIRNARWDAAWAAMDADIGLTEADALSLASSRVRRLLGLDKYGSPDLVATKGGTLLELQSKVVAVISPARGLVDIF